VNERQPGRCAENRDDFDTGRSGHARKLARILTTTTVHLECARTRQPVSRIPKGYSTWGEGGGLSCQSVTCVHRRYYTKLQRSQERYTGPLKKNTHTQRTPYFRFKLSKHITSLALPGVQLPYSTQNRSSDTGYPDYDLSCFFVSSKKNSVI
jgi:hypothetical protein